MGHVLYWVNRVDLSWDARRSACVVPLQVLSRYEAGAAAGALMELQRSYVGEALNRLQGAEPVHLSVGEVFQPEVTEILREALTRPEVQKGPYVHSRGGDIREFCVSSLASWGTPADIAFLRRFADDREIGGSAIAAIRALEERLGNAR